MNTVVRGVHRGGSRDLCWAVAPGGLRGSPGAVCGMAQGPPVILGFIKLGMYLQISLVILNELFLTAPSISELF